MPEMVGEQMSSGWSIELVFKALGYGCDFRTSSSNSGLSLERMAIEVGLSLPAGGVFPGLMRAAVGQPSCAALHGQWPRSHRVIELGGVDAGSSGRCSVGSCLD